MQSSPTGSKPALTTLAELPVLNSNAYTSSPKPQSALSRIRQILREPVAEFAGVALLVIFGTGVNCQASLSTNSGVASSPKGDFLSVSFGWAVGISLGVWISGGISGGHINPAITLGMAVWRGFPWRKVPGYIFAQLLGGIFGAAMVYGNFIHAIDIVEGGHDIRTRATASLFATYSLDYMTAVSCFFNEFIGTMILALMIVAVSDNHNLAPPKGLLPLVLFIVLLGLAASLGMQTSFAYNPARDFGPRLTMTFAGYGKQLYTYRNQYWLWCPIIAPFLGAQFGIGFYDLFLKQQDSADCSADTQNGERRLRSGSEARENLV
ncbi:aquaporin [Phlegmacium glaucopus]|nr:aquaporin [Phlegmacium glaucopus]